MQKRGGQLIYSPSDLIRFLDSPYASWMERLHLEFPDRLQPDEETAEQRLVANTGEKHETNYLQHLERSGKEVFRVPRGDTAEARRITLEAITAGHDIIYQARLELVPFVGFADFLLRSPDSKGPFYEVCDTKLAHSVKPYYLVQLCAYGEMLKAIQGEMPQRVRVVLGDRSERMFRTFDYFYYYQSVKEAFLRQMEEFDPNNPPVPEPRANHGRWQSHADRFLEEQDHPIQVAGITLGQIQKLNRAGITTLTQLAGSGGTHVARLSHEIHQRLAEQADLQLRTRRQRANAPPDKAVPPVYVVLRPTPNDPRRGLALLPPPSAFDVCFDMEGFPLDEGGLEYLFGAVDQDASCILHYHAWWAHDRAAEKTAFEAFVDWAFARWKKDPTMHIYHYAHYEVSAVRRLMGSHATREEEVDALLRHQVFVDLYQVVRQGLRVGESGYSIKSIERLYRPPRSGEVKAAGESIVQYACWRESGQPADWRQSQLLRQIRDYNEDDCRSTWQLLEWLRCRQKEHKVPYMARAETVSETETDEGQDETVRERLALVAALCNPIPQDPAIRAKNADRWQIQELLAQFVEFHRREAKPVWWRMFDRSAMSPAELVEDPNCLGGLSLISDEPGPENQSLVFRYRFDPDQDTKIFVGCKVMFAHDLRVTMEVVELEPAGRVAVKIGQSQLDNVFGGQMPRTGALIPNEWVNPRPIPNALLAIAAQWKDEQFVTPALRRLLLRQPPQISGRVKGTTLLKSGESPSEAALRVARSMRESTLCIQGPPGAGKTETGAQIIAELLGRGKKVGITSNSHKAIFNLLQAVGQKLPGGVSGCGCVRDVPEDFIQKHPTFQFNETNAAAAGAHVDGLIAGTAWLFARDDMVERLDYLFVDEAGQVSLANVAAMSRAAANLVLLGDQMQLEQPVQGAHPGQSGASALGYYLQDHAVIPDDLGIFLASTFRMHPKLCRFVSEMVYEGRLQAESGNERQVLHLPTGIRWLRKTAGILFSAVAHEGNSQCSDEEVARVAAIVKELLTCRLTKKSGKPRRLELNDILCVAPYNMQVRRLQAALPADARIGSVDKFQGQQAAVVIISMCSSFGEAGPRGLSFLLDKNRINVALSRATTLAIVVGDPRLVYSPANSIADVERINLYCRLVADSKH